MGRGGEQPVTDDGPCPCSIREYSVTRILFHCTLSPIYEKLALRLSRVGNIIKKNHLKKKVFFEKLVAPKRAVTPRNEAHRKGKSSRQPAKFLRRRDYRVSRYEAHRKGKSKRQPAKFLLRRDWLPLRPMTAHCGWDGGRGLFQHLAPPLRLPKRLDWRGSWLPKSYFEATCTNAYTRGSTTDARYSVVIILNKYPINSDLEEGIWFYSLYYITIF